MFGPSTDELSPPSASELLPGSASASADVTELEDALKEISREISSEFSCARETDPSSSSGQTLRRASGTDGTLSSQQGPVTVPVHPLDKEDWDRK